VKNIEMFIDEGGEITIGPIGPVACAATAADHHIAPAMLARREGETLNAFFPGGKGTADMVRRAHAAQIRVVAPLAT